MLKNILKVNGAQQLSNQEQKSIQGGWDTGFCDRLYASGDCCDPRWSRCGFNGSNACINGVCTL